MSSWDVWFEDVWDAIVAKVIAIADFGATKVFYGRKFPPTAFPGAFVQPLSAESSSLTFRESSWRPVFRIYVVVENPDTKVGVLAIWQLVGKIIDALEADRTLGQLLHTLQCRAEDSPEGLGSSSVEQHWVAVDVTCTRKM